MKSIPSSGIAIFVRHITFNCILFVSFLIVLISDILNVIRFAILTEWSQISIFVMFWIQSPNYITIKKKEKESGYYAIGSFVLAYSTEINATLLDKISLRCNPFHLFLFSRWFYSLCTPYMCVTIDMLVRCLYYYYHINLTTILTRNT